MPSHESGTDTPLPFVLSVPGLCLQLDKTTPVSCVSFLVTSSDVARASQHVGVAL